MGKQSEALSLLRLFDGLPGKCADYARSLDAEGGAYYLIAGVLLLFSVIGLEYLHNPWENLFWSTVTQQNSGMVRTCAVTFALLAFAWSFVTSYATWIRSAIELHWRARMTEKLTKMWLDKHVHFCLQLQDGTEIDNPDQRIQEDVDHFTSQTVELMWDALDHVNYFVVFFACGCCSDALKLSVDSGGTCPKLVSDLSGHLVNGWDDIRALHGQADVAFECPKRIVRSRCAKRFVPLQRTCGKHRSVRSWQVGAQKADVVFRSPEVLHNNMQLQKRVDIFKAFLDYVQWMLPTFILLPCLFQKQVRFGAFMQISGPPLPW